MPKDSLFIHNLQSFGPVVASVTDPYSHFYPKEQFSPIHSVQEQILISHLAQGCTGRLRGSNPEPFDGRKTQNPH